LDVIIVIVFPENVVGGDFIIDALNTKELPPVTAEENAAKT
jgi:hypothetical protein